MIVLTASALLLSACGGDSSPQKAPPGSPQNPLQGLPNPTPTRTPPTSENGAAETSKSKSSSSVREGTTSARSIVAAQKRTQAHNERARARRATATATTGRVNGRGPRKQKLLPASATRPCSLVSEAQARAIIGVPILAPIEAPQGPTCIYQSTSGKQFITLTVQSTDFTSLKTQIHARRNVTVSDRQAICGDYGRPMLYMPLGGARVLSVAGPCELATRFAARAFPRLSHSGH